MRETLLRIDAFILLFIAFTQIGLIAIDISIGDMLFETDLFSSAFEITYFLQSTGMIIAMAFVFLRVVKHNFSVFWNIIAAITHFVLAAPNFFFLKSSIIHPLLLTQVLIITLIHLMIFIMQVYCSTFCVKKNLI